MSPQDEVFSVRPTPELPMAGIVGHTAEAVCDLFGPPSVDRVAGADRWLVYRYDDVTVRIRCHREGPAADGVDETRPETTDAHRVVSWTAAFAGGRTRLKEVAEPLGLWPACAPDVGTGEVRYGLLRRAITDPTKGVIRSFTASVRGGLIRQISVFDEPPEWLGACPSNGAAAHRGHTRVQRRNEDEL